MEFLFQTLKTNYYSCLREFFFKNILYPLSKTRPRYQEILWSRDLLFIFTRSHMILLEILRELISSCVLTEDLCLKISHEILAEILTRDAIPFYNNTEVSNYATWKNRWRRCASQIRQILSVKHFDSVCQIFFEYLSLSFEFGYQTF